MFPILPMTVLSDENDFNVDENGRRKYIVNVLKLPYEMRTIFHELIGPEHKFTSLINAENEELVGEEVMYSIWLNKEEFDTFNTADNLISIVENFRMNILDSVNDNWFTPGVM